MRTLVNARYYDDKKLSCIGYLTMVKTSYDESLDVIKKVLIKGKTGNALHIHSVMNLSTSHIT